MTVSIIIPVYQVASYIEDCLRSVMRQTYIGSMECILIDDCGTDESIDIAERMIAEYKGPIRFAVLRHEKNRGLSAARNTGLRQAVGDYIFFLDSDDKITDNCIELLAKRAEEDPTVELVLGRANNYPIKKKRKLSAGTQIKVTNNDEVRRCFFQTEQFPVTAWNKLIRRSFLIEHKIWFREGVIFEDTPWTFCMLKFLSNLIFIGDITYNYKRRADSIVSETYKKERARSFRENYHYILTNLTLNHEKEEVNFYAERFSYIYARYSSYAPELKDDYLQWKNKADVYGSRYARMRLNASRLMEKSKCGWLVLYAISRTKSPAFILSDIKRTIIRCRRKLTIGLTDDDNIKT